MTRVLLDTNCLIDLREDGERAPGLGRVVAGFHAGEHQVVVAAITASENPRRGSPPKSWSEFTALLSDVGLADVGLADVEVLKPMGYWGVTFWGQALWVGDDMVELEASIHAVLFPTLGRDDKSDGRRWRNAKCDVQMVWTAMWNSVDVLLTSDARIVSRGPALATIRPIEILTPTEFLETHVGHADPPPGPV